MSRRSVRTVLAGILVVLVSAGGCGGGGDAAGPAAEQPASPAGRGHDVAEAHGCTTCHSADGSQKLGPTWKGIWGTTVTFADGRRAEVDRSYVEHAVRDPRADIVAGYPMVMPTIDLTQAEIDDVAAYIESLG
jgi:cytochrome c oxidase subunit 2